jgi:hypothetical protein
MGSAFDQFRCPACGALRDLYYEGEGEATTRYSYSCPQTGSYVSFMPRVKLREAETPPDGAVLDEQHAQKM